MNVAALHKTGYLREWGYVLTGVGLLATSHQIYWSDLHETFTRDVSLDEEVTVKFH